MNIFHLFLSAVVLLVSKVKLLKPIYGLKTVPNSDAINTYRNTDTGNLTGHVF